MEQVLFNIAFATILVSVGNAETLPSQLNLFGFARNPTLSSNGTLSDYHWKLGFQMGSSSDNVSCFLFHVPATDS